MDILSHRYSPSSKLLLINITQRSNKLLVGLAYFAKEIQEDFLECSTTEHDYYYVIIPDECKHLESPVIQVNTELELINHHA